MSQPEPILNAGPLVGAHALPADVVLARLGVSSDQGLSDADVGIIRAKFGQNLLSTKPPISAGRIFLNQFKSTVVYLLLAAAVISLAFQEWQEGSAILAVLILNAAIGFSAEIRARRTMEALRRIGSHSTLLRRDGRTLTVPAEDLVPGDIVILDAGDVVTADLRLIEAANLYCDESTLTGESVPVDKNTDPVEADAPVADRKPMMFKGTSVTQGTGLAVVVATGMQSELGRVTQLVSEADSEFSPLEKRLARLSGQLVWVTLVLVILIAAVGIVSGKDVYLMVEASIALAIAAIPEGLPIVATLTLARGMWRMARRNALVERLSAVETLGATNVIFSDKTGTLTENRMSVASLWLPSGEYVLDNEHGAFFVEGRRIDAASDAALQALLKVGVLCNNADLEGDGDTGTGDPMELALLQAGRFAALEQHELAGESPRLHEFPFDPDQKMMATAHGGNGVIAFAIKGAPEFVIANSAFVTGLGGDIELGPEERQRWLDHTHAMAARGLRVLAMARLDRSSVDEFTYEGFTLLGLTGLFDPPRSDVPAALADCARAGIRVIMVTGDHAVTASNIAAQIGLTGPDAVVMEGHHLKPLAAMSEQERADLANIDIFARVTPAQKLDLITAFQEAGNVVAMTGDGVNDAPALQKADIGIAMGQRGTQVAREAADMVLRDDAFPSIVEAVREGRAIFANIQRFVIYLLSCNLSEVLVVALAVSAGMPLPLLPLQILFLNLVTDVFPAFALGFGRAAAGTLSQAPRQGNIAIIERRHWRIIVLYGLAITFVTLAALAVGIYGLDADVQTAVTMSFLTLAFAQLWHVFNMRAVSSPLIVNEITANRFVWGALVICTVLLLAAVYFPPLARVLHTVPIGQTEWLWVISLSLVPLVAGQIAKIAAKARAV